MFWPGRPEPQSSLAFQLRGLLLFSRLGWAWSHAPETGAELCGWMVLKTNTAVRRAEGKVGLLNAKQEQKY